MKIENIEKRVASLHDKTEHVIQIRNLKQELLLLLNFYPWLNHELVLEKVHRVTKFN